MEFTKIFIFKNVFKDVYKLRGKNRAQTRFDGAPWENQF